MYIIKNEFHFIDKTNIFLTNFLPTSLFTHSHNYEW